MTSIRGLLLRLHMLRLTASAAWRRRHERVNLSDYWQRCPAETDRLARDVGLQPADIGISQQAALQSFVGAHLNMVSIEPRQLQAATPEYAADLARVSVLFAS